MLWLWLIVLIMGGVFLLGNEILYFTGNNPFLKFRKLCIVLFLILVLCSGYYLEIKLSVIFIWLLIWLLLISYSYRKKFRVIFPIAGIILILVLGNFLIDMVHRYYICTDIEENINIEPLISKYWNKRIYITISEKDSDTEKVERIYFYCPKDGELGQTYYIDGKDVMLNYNIADNEQPYLEIKKIYKITYDSRKPDKILEREFIRYEKTFFVPEDTIENKINSIEE